MRNELNEVGYYDDRRLFSRVGFGAAALQLVPQLILIGLALAAAAAGYAAPRFDAAPGALRFLRQAGQALKWAGPAVQSFVLVHVIGGLCYYLCIRRIPKAGPVQKQRWPWHVLAAFAIIGVAIAEIGNLLGNGLMILLNQNLGTSVSNQVQSLLNDSQLWQIFLVTVIAAPAVEEWLLRVLLIDRIRPYGDKWCILVSGLLFGLIHGNLYQFFYAFALGGMLAYVYLKTSRPSYVIGLHMFFNFTGGFVGAWFLEMLSRSGVDLTFSTMPALGGAGMAWLLLMEGFAFLMIGLTVAGVVLAVCFRKRVSLCPASRILPENGAFRTVFLNAGMLILFAVTAGLTLLDFVVS